VYAPHRNDRSFSVGDRFPATWLADQDGGSVPGKLDDVPLSTIRDLFIPAEPAELEPSVVELADGESALAVALPREVLGLDLVDSSGLGAGATTDPDSTTAGNA
jgi:hypothetical protein